MTDRALVTGATGFIGARLAARLASSTREVRCLVRDRGGTRARELERDGFDLHEGDVLRPDTLRGAGHRGLMAPVSLARAKELSGTDELADDRTSFAPAYAWCRCAPGTGGVGCRLLGLRAPRIPRAQAERGNPGVCVQIAGGRAWLPPIGTRSAPGWVSAQTTISATESPQIQVTDEEDRVQH